MAPLIAGVVLRCERATASSEYTPLARTESECTHALTHLQLDASRLDNELTLFLKKQLLDLRLPLVRCETLWMHVNVNVNRSSTWPRTPWSWSLRSRLPYSLFVTQSHICAVLTCCRRL